MTRELKNLTIAILAGFILIATSSAYWSVFQHEDLRTRPDNPRRIFAEQNFARGLILDRNGVVLAASNLRPGTAYRQRLYPYPHVGGAVGYYSYRYGAEGLEAAFNDVLLGRYGSQDAWQVWWNGLLNHPLAGYDLRSTIDLQLQQTLSLSLGEGRGAAVVIQIPSGAIWAMVSQPQLDPNTVDLNWDVYNSNLTASPLLNRVRRGVYQPGSALQPVLLAGLLVMGDRLDRPTPNASDIIDLAPIEPGLQELTCLAAPPDPENMRLRDAFAYGCPQPFVEVFRDPAIVAGYENVWISRFGFLEPPPLYRMDTGGSTTPAPLHTRVNPIQAAILEAVGQGQLTVTPLQMAQFMAAVANGGAAPYFYMADAYRKPGETQWRSFVLPPNLPPFLPPELAAQMRVSLHYTAEHSPLVKLAIPAGSIVPVYGYVGMAYAGKPLALLSWFTGFIDLPDGSSFVLVVIVEDAQTVTDAVLVAHDAFALITQTKNARLE